MSSPRLARLVAALPLLAAAACIHGQLPARELYRLAPIDTLVGRDGPLIEASSQGHAAAPALVGALGGALAVAPYQTPGVYGDGPIVFRIGETEYGQYPAREWALPLGDMLGMLTERVLRGGDAPGLGVVYDPPSRRDYPYLWRGTVREFDEVDRGKQVYAAVRLEVQLVRSADDAVVWSGSAGGERLVADPTMPHIVEALTALAVSAVERLATDVRADLARAPAQPAPTPP